MSSTVRQGSGMGQRNIGRRAFAGMVLSGVALPLLSACAPVYENHGYIPDQKDLDKIQVGRDTRETVQALLGPPSVDGLLSDTGWYYVQSRWKTVSFGQIREIDRQVVAITFNEEGIVTNVERFGMERGQIVPLSRRVTTEPIKGESILARLFANIGATGAAQQAAQILNP